MTSVGGLPISGVWLIVHRRLSALCALAVAASTLATLSPADAADDEWAPLQDAGGSTLAVPLDNRTTALVSVGGPDDATIYEQRRTAGTLGPSTEVMTVEGATSCRPVEAVTELGNFAVAVECQVKTGLEDPPTRLVELVWTGDDGWVWHVLPEGDLGSLDYSPQGQFVVFTSNSGYGRPHHVTSYHADLGWRDLTRRELRLTGDDMVAAISDTGNVVALRGAGSEDEPGSWYGGRLRIETYHDTAGKWTQQFTRDYPGGGINPSGIDMAAGRIVATVGRVAVDRRAQRPRGQGRRTVRQAERPSVLVVASMEPSGPHGLSGYHFGRCRRLRLAGGP